MGVNGTPQPGRLPMKRIRGGGRSHNRSCLFVLAFPIGAWLLDILLKGSGAA